MAMETVTLKDQNLYYKREGLEYRIRGFEDTFLSHLRVNIKVTSKDDFFIDIVDLYSQKSRATFMNKVCAQLRMNREDLKRDLYTIIDAIEKYQSDNRNIYWTNLCDGSSLDVTNFLYLRCDPHL